jgi:Bacterial regulatory proteins, luxR family
VKRNGELISGETKHFTSIGMEAFAERARKEVLVTGGRVRKQAVEARDDLSSQERQVAQLARDGLSNAEIGARLFLSSRTVEWHLRSAARDHLPQGLHDALPSPHQEPTSATGPGHRTSAGTGASLPGMAETRSL